MKSLLPVIIILPSLITGCAMTHSKTPQGGVFTTASLLENATNKITSYDPATGMVTVSVTDQNQTEGAKVIATGLVSLKTIDATADYLLKRLGKNQAIETATIEASSQLDTLTEANRSAEALKALELTAP
jgi:hypothetical protein